MTASDYPVTFGYKAVDGVFYGPNGSVGLYHKGEDRSMPVGTPIAVNDVIIGYSGSMYGGAHLHIGRFVGGYDTNPNGGGFNVSNARVTEINEDSINGKYVRLSDADGSSWVYLHMSDNHVLSVGDVLDNLPKYESNKEDDMPVADRGFVINRYRQILGRDCSEAEINIYVDLPHDVVYDAMLDSAEFKARIAGNVPINKGDVINYLSDNLK